MAYSRGSKQAKNGLSLRRLAKSINAFRNTLLLS